MRFHLWLLIALAVAIEHHASHARSSSASSSWPAPSARYGSPIVCRDRCACGSGMLARVSIADLPGRQPTSQPACHSSSSTRRRSTRQDRSAPEAKARCHRRVRPTRPRRVDRHGYHWRTRIFHGFDHLFGHDPARLAEFARTTDRGGVPSRCRTSAGFPAASLLRFPPRTCSACRFITTSVPIEEIDSASAWRSPRFARTRDAFVYQVRVRCPASCSSATRGSRFFDVLRTGQWPDADRAAPCCWSARHVPRSTGGVERRHVAHRRVSQRRSGGCTSIRRRAPCWCR